MDKLKLIRENEELFKKHLQDVENLEIQKKENKINNMILELNQENKKQNQAEKYLMELRQKSSAENSGLIKNNINKNNNYPNNKLHENLNNFVFNQIYDDSEDEYGKEDNVLQYNINDKEFENYYDKNIKHNFEEKEKEPFDNKFNNINEDKESNISNKKEEKNDLSSKINEDNISYNLNKIENN